jgi:FMN phosphatase YigB (HAD superfamily)
MMTPSFRPKYITFDCYGTLIHFQMVEAARDLYGREFDEGANAGVHRGFLSLPDGSWRGRRPRIQSHARRGRWGRSHLRQLHRVVACRHD